MQPAFVSCGPQVAGIAAPRLASQPLSRPAPASSQTWSGWWQAAVGAFCAAVASRAAAPGRAARRQRIQMQVYMYEDEDGPDDFFNRPPAWEPKVKPAWNTHRSPSKQRLNNSVTFFFPNRDYRETEHQNFINPKMYKRVRPDKKLRMRQRRTEKRAWRKLSNRLKNEWRFRRYPRDESGKVTAGVFNGKRRKTYLDMRGASPAYKK
mmetsp:Transcript_100916/g.240500  ORF Transcript_100916/g.240500 Transcript_100916/m.240500 type:complete len:207 (+) Transcript_100916:40-660(+)